MFTYTTTSLDIHANRAEDFEVHVRNIAGVSVPVLQIESMSMRASFYLTEEQIDSVGEAILAHQGRRKTWSTAQVIDNQLQEVKLNEKSCLG